MNVSQKIAALVKDVDQLASVTGALGWDRSGEELIVNPSDLGAKPIPRDQWARAVVVAGMIAEKLPYLDPPVPGADPEGFVWLTWTQGDKRGLALEIRRNQYKWTQRSSESKRTIVSDSLDDVLASARTVFTARTP